MLSLFPDVTQPEFSGVMSADVRALLNVNNKSKTFEHVNAVAEMNMMIAERYRLDKSVCKISGYIHDISAVISPNSMMEYAERNGWLIDVSERKYPFLLHQRISKVIAERDFGITDERVLSCVECHTTLKANPSAYDMALFVADKLAWDQDGLPPFYAVVSDALKQSLEAASLAYMDYIVENKMILHPHKWFEAGVKSLRRMVGE